MGNAAINYNDPKIYMQVDPWSWAYFGRLQLPDAMFTLEGNEPQVGYMQSDARRKCVRKATQFAFTTSEVIDSLHGCRYGHYPKGVLYMFPTRNDVADFSSSRFGPILSENHDLIGQHVRETDRENLKRIGRGFLFFRSGTMRRQIEGQAKTSAALKSIPADKCVFDEYDEMDQGARGLAIKRMEDSTIKREVYLANPTMPDYGIDAIYEKESDRGCWLHVCPGCRSDQVLELTFPDCLQRRPDGAVVRVCVKCGHILHPSGGQWVARNPDRSSYMEGYWISHLNKAKTDPAEILATYEKLPMMKAVDVVHFWNLIMGIGYVEAQNRLSIQQVLALCGDHGIQATDYGPCTMGVDQGSRLHAVIGNPRGKIVYIDILNEWEQLDRLMADFNVAACVVDALPEQRNARAFADRFKGRVWLNFYNDNQKGDYAWKEGDCIVQCNRTESLDNSHKAIEHGIPGMLPRDCDMLQTFADHMHNVAKKLVEDAATGSSKHVYIRLGGEDHFRHAFNYQCIAKDAPKRLFNWL